MIQNRPFYFMLAKVSIIQMAKTELYCITYTEGSSRLKISPAAGSLFISHHVRKSNSLFITDFRQTKDNGIPW